MQTEVDVLGSLVWSFSVGRRCFSSVFRLILHKMIIILTTDMGFFRRSADFRRLRGPTGHF